MMGLPTIERHELFSGTEKAAILLLAVGQERAAKLCALLDRHEVIGLSRTMLAVGHVEPATVDQLLVEFKARLEGPAGVTGGMAATQKLLAATLGSDAAGSILSEAQGGVAGSVWDELAAIGDDVLAAYLGNEHPQTAALIVSRLGAEQSARILARLPAELATEVILRVLRLDAVEDEVMADVERTLQEELTAGLASGPRRDAHKSVAMIFDHFDRSTEGRLMQSLEEANRDAAERVRSHMFTFADLVRIDAAGVQLLIRAAGNDRLTRALKGAGEPVRELFFANMSERSAKMLREEMQAMGPIRLKDVEEAQQFLVNMAKELAASGQIALAQGEDEELVD